MGSVTITFSTKAELAKKLDELAQKYGVGRSKLISMILERALCKEVKVEVVKIS